MGNELTCAFVRFANTLVISNHSLTDILNILKEIKYTISVDKVCKNYLYENSEIHSIVTTFEKTLNVKSSEIILGNMTDTTLKTAAEMFLYVNSCTYLLTPWLSFCKNLFENESSSTILLSLNRVLKVGDTRENKDLKIVVKKLFHKSNSLFSIKYGKSKGMSGTDLKYLYLKKKFKKIKACQIHEISIIKFIRFEMTGSAHCQPWYHSWYHSWWASAWNSLIHLFVIVTASSQNF